MNFFNFLTCAPRVRVRSKSDHDLPYILPFIAATTFDVTAWGLGGAFHPTPWREELSKFRAPSVRASKRGSDYFVLREKPKGLWVPNPSSLDQNPQDPEVLCHGLSQPRLTRAWEIARSPTGDVVYRPVPTRPRGSPQMGSTGRRALSNRAT